MPRVYPHPELIVPQTFKAREYPSAAYSRTVSSKSAFDVATEHEAELLEQAFGRVVGSGPATHAFATTTTPNGRRWSYPAEVLADSPLLYWRLGASTMTNLAEGADASGNGREPIWFNVSPTPGWAFDGIGAANFVNQGAGAENTAFNSADLAAVFTSRQNRTIEFVFKRDTSANPHMLFCGSSAANQGAPYSYAGGGVSGISARSVRFAPAGNNSTITTWTDALPAHAAVSTWTHIAFVFVNSATIGTVTLYVNSTAVSTQANLSDWGASSTAQFGRWGFGPPASFLWPFDGQAGEIAIYPAALSAARIAAHVAAR